jgi:uncharacterized membrane protein YhaH (DUF805 family)
MGYLFSFQGRLRRLGYFGLGILQALILFGFVLTAGAALVGLKHADLGVAAGLGALALTLLVLVIWIGFSAVARRVRDMGMPVGPFIAILFIVSFGNGVCAVLARHAPALGLLSLLLGGAYAVMGFMLTFWRSAPQAEFDNSRLDDIFGEAALAAADSPALIKPPSRIPLFDGPKPSEPVTQPVWPAPLPAVRDASGRIVPRGQFGLRQQGY